MAASGFTPIQLFRTTTAAAVPTAGSLADGELAINLTDEKLYFKNASGTVKLLASSGGASGTVTSIDVSGGTTGLTFSGGPITSSGTITMAGTLGVANGGTGASSLTSGYLVKGNGTSAVSSSVIYDDGTNVGIGTASPSQKLTVAVADGAQAAQFRGATGYLRVRPYVDATNGAYIDATNTAENAYLPLSMAGSSIRLTTNGGLAATIDSSGNVGIGTSSPSYRLDVAGDFRSSGYIINNNGASLYTLFANDGGNSFINAVGAGNVGIGTASPGAKLHVYQDSSSTSVMSGVLVQNVSFTTNAQAGVGLYAADNYNAKVYTLRSGSSAGNLVFGVNNGSGIGEANVVERMRIDSSGNVGIGTSSPGGKLDVTGSVYLRGVPYLDSDGSSNYLRIGPSGTYIQNTGGGSNFGFWSNTGNLGIGTTSITAGYKLDVAGSANASGSFVSGGGTTNQTLVGNKTLLFYNTSVSEGVIQSADDTSTFTSVGISKDVVRFATQNSERMRIDGSGNVGIGTSSPGAKLHVVGGPSTLTLTNTDAASFAGVAFTDGTNTKGQIWVGNGSYASFGGAGSINYSANSGPHVWYTNYAERMRLDNSGNVGIGTTSPGYKLDVSGGALGTTAGNSLLLSRLYGSTANTVNLQTTLTRASNGSDWTTSRIRTQAQVDATLFGYMDFLPAGAGGALAFGNDATEFMRITAAGSVGIGTSSPGAKLAVDTVGTSGVGLIVQASSLTASQINMGIGVITAGYPFIGTNTSTNPLQFGVRDATDVIFVTSAAEKMRLTSGGNVGIGTTAPASRLHVGSGYITAGSSSSTSGSKILAGEYSNAEHITTFGSDYSSGGPVIGYGVWPSTTSSGAFISSAAVNIQRSAYLISGQTHIWYSGAAQNIAVGSAVTVTERMRLDASGNLGIGTSSISYRLHVNSGAATTVGFFQSTGTSSFIGLSNASYTTYLGSFNDGSFRIQTPGSGFSDKVTVDISGNLLVGTTSATSGYLMSVNGALTLANGYSLSWGAYNSGGPTIAGSTNFLAFYPNGASSGEKMRITSAGQLLLGTTSLATKLGVVGYDTTYNNTATFSSGLASQYLDILCGFALTNGTPGGVASNTTMTLRSSGSSAGELAFATGNTEQMRITSGGNVGIGSTVPIGKLGVSMGSATGAGNTAAWDNTYALFGGVTANAAAVGIGFNTSAGGVLSSLAPGVTWHPMNYQASSHIFYGSAAERMRIDSSGNLLVGGSTAFGRITLQGNTNTDLDVWVRNDNAGSSSRAGIVLNASGNSWRMGMGSSANNSNALTWNVDIGGANTERMRIDTSGNLLVGTTTAQGKLSVNSATGNIGFNTGTSSSPERGNLWYDTDGTGWKFNIGKRQSGSFTAQMTFQDNGNVGIGTTSPGAKLEVAGGGNIRLTAASDGSNGVLQIYNSTQATLLQSYCDTNNGYIAVVQSKPLILATNNTERARISAAGGFSVGTTADPGAGAIYATGNITAYYSDEQLKTRLGNIDNALDILSEIDAFYYEANETAQALGYEAVREVGVSAQSVQRVLPEVVAPAPIDNKYLTVRYERLVPVLIEAIKELTARVAELEGK